MEVHLVWHVRHARNLDGSPAEHRDADGALQIDDEYDDVKIIGVYGSGDAARAAIARARTREGFREEPDCFQVDPYVIGEDHWTEGFATIPVDGG
jgi:hypothetical protein